MALKQMSQLARLRTSDRFVAIPGINQRGYVHREVYDAMSIRGPWLTYTDSFRPGLFVILGVKNGIFMGQALSRHGILWSNFDLPDHRAAHPHKTFKDCSHRAPNQADLVSEHLSIIYANL